MAAAKIRPIIRPFRPPTSSPPSRTSPLSAPRRSAVLTEFILSLPRVSHKGRKGGTSSCPVPEAACSEESPRLRLGLDELVVVDFNFDLARLRDLLLGKADGQHAVFVIH